MLSVPHDMALALLPEPPPDIIVVNATVPHQWLIAAMPFQAGFRLRQRPVPLSVFAARIVCLCDEVSLTDQPPFPVCSHTRHIEFAIPKTRKVLAAGHTQG